jgi:hypothetical protein
VYSCSEKKSGQVSTCRIGPFPCQPTWMVRFRYLYTLGTWWPNYIPRHWVPFSSPPTTTVEIFDLTSTLGGPAENTVSIVIAQQYFDCCLRNRCRRNLFTESLPSNERLLWIRHFGFQASCHTINYRTKHWHIFNLLEYRNIITVKTPKHSIEFDIANILSFTWNRVLYLWASCFCEDEGFAAEMGCGNC